MWDPQIVAMVVATFLLAGFIKGVIGMGLPVVALAFLGSTLGVREALTIMLIPGLATNTYQALAGPAFGTLLRRLWSFLAAAALGIWFGVGVLAGAKSETMVLLLGVTLCTYCAVTMLRAKLPPPGKREPWMSPLMGGMGGVMFGMTGIMIVPGILYLQTLGLNRHMFVQALGITFVSITLALGTSLLGRSLLTQDLVLMSLTALVPTALGLVLGQRYRHHISEERFRRIFLIALLVIGLDMLRRTLL
ncbi:MAG TPA: sulfite exporter TauE/SafE family protein [Thermohalobaculum sp.]|nr:sulfite exporter TauE/SafE family protein [Thermohalobaculum sp.]